MDARMFARLGAVVFIAVAVAAAVAAMMNAHEETEPLALRDRPIAPQDPLAAELLRCSGIGEAGPRDPRCLKAWTESRRRFLRQRAPATTPDPIAPTTQFPNVPASADPSRKDEEGNGLPTPSMPVTGSEVR